MIKVLAGGKFNAIHPGHIYFLERAKSFGYLIIVLAHDSRNKRSYASSLQNRMKDLEKTKIPDKIIAGDKKDFTKIVRHEKPDIIVLGYDQKLPKTVTKLVKSQGILVEKIERFGKYSTRKIKKKVKRKTKRMIKRKMKPKRNIKRS